MRLNLLYLPNESAEKILGLLKAERDDIECSQVDILSRKYWLIKIDDILSQSIRIINTPQAIQNCINEETLSSILSINRMSYGNNENENIIRRYEVLICDMKLISMRVKYTIKGKESSRYIKENENNKVVEQARRVTHLLGLDMAMVTIGLTAKRRWKIMDVEPSPIVRDQDCEAIVKKITTMYRWDEYLNNTEIKLGADPEFMMFNTKNGKMLSASDYFPREGIVGCDNIRIPNRVQRPVAEIRPRPDTCPLKLTDNIKQALNTASRMAPYHKVRWAAGSQPAGGFSIGGHIHFSSIKINAWLLTALDNYLGIPIFLIEEQATAVKRRKKYGYLGDYRLKDHGGFEYRTPGSWLVSREITTAVLCLAKIIASNFPGLKQNHLNSPEAQAAFYSGDRDFFRPVFAKLWRDIKSCAMFDLYAEQLEVLPQMINEGLCWDERSDFRKAWKLVIPSRKKDFKTQDDDKLEDLPSNIARLRGSLSPGFGSAANRGGSGGRGSGVVVTTPRAAGISRNQAYRRSASPASGRITTPHQVRRSHVIR